MIQKLRLSRPVITFILLSTILYAQEISLKKRIVSFQGLKPSPTHCQLGLKAQFLDDSTLLISNPICAKGGRNSSYQHAIANLDGNVRSSVELSEGSNNAYIGPPGYLFFPADHRGWLIYDTGLQPKWRVPIPSGEFPGSIALSPSRTAAALSSHAAGEYSKYRWQIFTGDPLTKIGEYTGPLPFPGVTDSGAVKPVFSGKASLASFEPNPSELWFFDTNYQLTRRSNTSSDMLLPEAAWLAPKSQETFCSESLSASQPRRILAYCSTTVFLPRGFALLVHTALYAHLRYIVYDATGNILTKGTYTYDSPPSLSPNGRRLALTQGKNVILYDLP
jgi:hypothetical protein